MLIRVIEKKMKEEFFIFIFKIAVHAGPKYSFRSSSYNCENTYETNGKTWDKTKLVQMVKHEIEPEITYRIILVNLIRFQEKLEPN